MCSRRARTSMSGWLLTVSYAHLGGGGEGGGGEGGERGTREGAVRRWGREMCRCGSELDWSKAGGVAAASRRRERARLESCVRDTREEEIRESERRAAKRASARRNWRVRKGLRPAMPRTGMSLLEERIPERVWAASRYLHARWRRRDGNLTVCQPCNARAMLTAPLPQRSTSSTTSTCSTAP